MKTQLVSADMITISPVVLLFKLTKANLHYIRLACVNIVTKLNIWNPIIKNFDHYFVALSMQVLE